ncbi:MAG: tyrosine-type recombinase/integrase [Acidimicrobiales bacterium]
MTALPVDPLGSNHHYTGEIPDAWTPIHKAAPLLAQTMLTYLDQVKVSLRPTSVRGIETDLRVFAVFLIGHDPALEGAGDIERHHIEAFKTWQAAQPGQKHKTFAPSSLRRRLTHLRMFFIRITEWDWDDAPARVPIFFGDVPKRDESLPKFLDDPAYARFMRTLAAEPHLYRRVAVEMLARTGMRVGELCDLETDAVTIIGDAPWLRVPVGKLHNDRYVPLHPELVDLLDVYTGDDTQPHTTGRLLSGRDGPLNRHAITRWIAAIARRADIGHVHPHQLRHTLATQAINRGMSIEAIAALLGHRSLDMTRNYARIANRVVADEYAAVTAKVEALYTTTLPAETEGPNMARLRTEHHRMLANGYCTRPPELDCHYESICETCTHYRTDLSFQPVLLRQRDHALKHGQDQRADLYTGLLDNLHPDQ